jgi:hypothetical protein
VCVCVCVYVYVYVCMCAGTDGTAGMRCERGGVREGVRTACVCVDRKCVSYTSVYVDRKSGVYMYVTKES